MKLSKKEQYAIKAMMNLALNYNNQAVTLTEISSSNAISLSYLEQLFSILRAAGLVQGVRGPGGGYRLAKSPDLISIAAIVSAIEASTEKASSKQKVNSEVAENYIANRLWNELSDQFMSYLNSITLAEIIKDQIVIKRQYHLDEITKRISTMFPVTENIRVA